MRGPFTHKVGPHVSVVVRRVSADSREVLFAESIQYGVEKNYLLDGARIDPPADSIFSNNDALSAQKMKVVEYLVQGVDAVAQVIAGRFSQ